MVDEILNNFPEITIIDELKNIRELLNKISDRIDNGDLEITLAKAKHFRNAIQNIYNPNKKEDKIIEIVKEKFKESIIYNLMDILKLKKK